VTLEDLPGAITQYERIIAEDPGELSARFRLAELCSENEDYRKAAGVYENILEQANEIGVDQHCSVLTRLSEIYAHRLDDADSARRHIHTIIKKYPDTKYAGYARDRLDSI
jgi:tetratricopeptide (TPR) repeat protein